MLLTRIVGVAGLLLVLAACGGSSGTAMDDGTYGADGTGSDASSSGVGGDGYGEGDAYSDQMDAGGALNNRVIYFAYDQADVPADSIGMLEAHGIYLADTSGATVRLEGHGDERGSREYNIGLGERRAQAVRQMLLLQGVSAVQMSTVSYGEERPAVLGSDDEAWGLNRRVEIVYVD
jgi:peptidoglycan-associated lipoprotein